MASDLCQQDPARAKIDLIYISAQSEKRRTKLLGWKFCSLNSHPNKKQENKKIVKSWQLAHVENKSNFLLSFWIEKYFSMTVGAKNKLNRKTWALQHGSALYDIVELAS